MSVRIGETEGLAHARMLIVEDESIVAKDLESSLRSLGYSICGVCTTGAEALQRAAATRPDVVLMDIRLRGGMDGIETARRIHQRVDVPVVFLTAYADTDTLNRAAEVGPYGYVLKPFDERELHSTLVMAMCKHRAFAELDRRVEERTKELASTEVRYRRLKSIADLGLFALGAESLAGVMQHAVALVAETLQLDLAGLLELMPDGGLLLIAGVGWQEGAPRTSRVSPEEGAEALLRLASSEPVVVADLAGETRFPTATLLQQHGAISGIWAAIPAPGPDGRPYGILQAHACARREYSQNDTNFMQAVANLLAATIIRSRAQTNAREAERIAREERTKASVAEDALRTREEFLSVAAHELRTPVAALQLQLEALKALVPRGSTSLHPLAAEKAERTVETVERLAGLVEGVLDVSREATGTLQLRREEFDLADAVRKVVGRHRGAAERAGSELRLSAAESVQGTWDRTRVERIVANLLSNALKFGFGKAIDVTVERRGDDAVLRVRDHGEGLDPADARRILERFERAVSHRNYGGLGLGLYVTKRNVEAHGGRIEVVGQPKQGATFTVVLPCRPEGNVQ